MFERPRMRTRIIVQVLATLIVVPFFLVLVLVAIVAGPATATASWSTTVPC